MRTASANPNVPCGDVRRVFAEAVPGHHIGPAAARLQDATSRDAHRENRRLRVFGEREAVRRTIEDQVTQRLAERPIGFVEHCPRFGKLRGEAPAHADRLRALAGKKEGNHVSICRLGSGGSLSNRLGTCGGGCRDSALDAAQHLAAHESRRHRHGVAHRLHRRAAMTDDAQAGDAHAAARRRIPNNRRGAESGDMRGAIAGNRPGSRTCFAAPRRADPRPSRRALR